MIILKDFMFGPKCFAQIVVKLEPNKFQSVFLNNYVGYNLSNN